jgi:hypothetical protein
MIKAKQKEAKKEKMTTNKILNGEKFHHFTFFSLGSET